MKFISALIAVGTLVLTLATPAQSQSTYTQIVDKNGTVGHLWCPEVYNSSRHAIVAVGFNTTNHDPLVSDAIATGSCVLSILGQPNGNANPNVVWLREYIQHVFNTPEASMLQKTGNTLICESTLSCRRTLAAWKVDQIFRARFRSHNVMNHVDNKPLKSVIPFAGFDYCPYGCIVRVYPSNSLKTTQTALALMHAVLRTGSAVEAGTLDNTSARTRTDIGRNDRWLNVDVVNLALEWARIDKIPLPDDVGGGDGGHGGGP